MITKKQVMEAAQRGEGPLGKAADDEPVFVLRAQDNLAADAVEQWAIRAQSQGTPYEKARLAFDIVDHMRHWPIHKVAD